MSTTQQDVNLVLSSISWVDFAENNFADPDYLESSLKLEPGQRKAIDCMQFGYDIESIPVDYEVKTDPKEIVMIWPRQFGKTTAVAVGSAVVLILRPRTKIGVMAQSEKIAKLIVDKTYQFIMDAGLEDQVEQKLKLEIRMKNGSFMEAHATSESIRGNSYHYLILDEVSRIPDDIIYGAAIPTARKLGNRIILLSTPKGYGGALIDFYRMGLKHRKIVCHKCHTEFTAAHFKEYDFGPMKMPKSLPPCPECEYDAGNGPVYDDDPDGDWESKTYFYAPFKTTVVSVDPFRSSFYTKEEIMAELERRGNTPLARQELLGEIVQEGAGIFRNEWLDAATNQSNQNIMNKKDNINYILAVDFGKKRDNSVIIIGHYDRNNKTYIVDYIRVIEAGNIEYSDVRDQIMEVVDFYEPIWVVPDATGVGEAIVEEMEKDLHRIGWRGRIYSNKKRGNDRGFYFTVKSKPEIIEYLQEVFASGRIQLPNKYEPAVEITINELREFSYEITKARNVKYGVQKEHDDTVVTLAMFVWAAKEQPWISPEATFAIPRGGLY